MKPRILLFHGETRAELSRLAPQSVHVCITSPPYYGLRDYSLPASVWGGDPTCRHRWVEHVRPAANGLINGPMRGESLSPRSATRKPTRSDFCANCGAWLGQLGLEPTPELYVEHLVEVCRALRRVLRPDATLWLNLGDSYWGGKGRSGTRSPEQAAARRDRTLNRPHQHLGGPGEVRPTDGRHPTIKSKDLIGIPWMVAFALRADGWSLRADIVWAKPNPMPESVKSRPTRTHEYVFMLAQSPGPAFWLHRDTRERRLTPPAPDYRYVRRAGGAEQAAEPPGWRRGGEWRRVNLWRGLSYYYDGEAIKEPSRSGPSDRRKMLERQPRLGGRHLTAISPLLRASAATNIGRRRAVGSPDGRARRSVWEVATQPAFWDYCAACGAYYEGGERRQIERIETAAGPQRRCPCGATDAWVDHFATFPAGLVAPMIAAATPAAGCCADCGAARLCEAGDWLPGCNCGAATVPCTVLDVFSGAGTTGKAAVLMGRNFVGIELNRGYLEMSRRRIARALAAGPLLVSPPMGAPARAATG